MICPPALIDSNLVGMMDKLIKEYPQITGSDIIRWGIAELKKNPSLFYLPAKPMKHKSPSVLLTSGDNQFLKERRLKYGITVSQSIRDSIFAAYHAKLKK
jgi:hypothetical protein